MRVIVLLWLLAGSFAAAADVFDDRVKAAGAAEADSRYRDYQTALFQAIGSDLAGAVNRCVTTTPNPDARPFALVADIDARGRPRAIDIRPQTNVGRCMAAAFAKLPFPKPPRLKGRNSVPVMLNLSIAP
ncbi:MAG: hypothetical protein HY255_08270 [Betaproteobacteria bacterium]|nr:hypothetical protein [Betaproteobacteria bacterium]